MTLNSCVLAEQEFLCLAPDLIIEDPEGY